MRWSYKAFYFHPGDDDPHPDEAKVRLSGDALVAEINRMFAPPAIERRLNQFGADGWELVAVSPVESVQNDGRCLAIMKRVEEK